MRIELTVLVSVISALVGSLGTVLTLRRNKSVDDKKDATEMTTVIVKLESIGSGVSEIKSDLRNMREDVERLRERMVAVESSTKSLHKRVDRIEGRPDRE